MSYANIHDFYDIVMIRFNCLERRHCTLWVLQFEIDLKFVAPFLAVNDLFQDVASSVFGFFLEFALLR